MEGNGRVTTDAGSEWPELFEMGFLFLGLTREGIHLLVAPGNSGVTKGPSVPAQPSPVPLSPGKGETRNASSERGFKALSCSRVRQCRPTSADHYVHRASFPPCHQGKQSMLSPRME